jgi:hypothetical protein
LFFFHRDHARIAQILNEGQKQVLPCGVNRGGSKTKATNKTEPNQTKASKQQ